MLTILAIAFCLFFVGWFLSFLFTANYGTSATSVYTEEPSTKIKIRGEKIKMKNGVFSSLDGLRRQVWFKKVFCKPEEKIKVEDFILTEDEITSIAYAAVFLKDHFLVRDIIKENSISVNLRDYLLRWEIKQDLKSKYMPSMLSSANRIFLLSTERDRKKFFLKAKRAINTLSETRAGQFEMAYRQGKSVRMDMWGDEY